MQAKQVISSDMLLFAVAPVILLLFGGIRVLWKKPSPALQSTILHFAAGVVFSVVAVELLPDMIRIHNALAIVIGFTLGIGAMLMLKWFTGRLESKLEVKRNGVLLPWGMLVAVGIDLVLDGFLLGIGFAAGAKEGILLAIALAIECLSLGLAVGTSLIKTAIPKRNIVTVLMVLGTVFLAGTGAGFFILHNMGDNTLELVLSFGSAALLFLVTEELLVEAHQQKDSPFYTGAFFAGFLLFIILGIII